MQAVATPGHSRSCNFDRSRIMDESTKRSIPPLWLAAAPLILKAGVVWLALAGTAAMADTHEATQLSLPPGAPDEYMQAGAALARSLDPNLQNSLRDCHNRPLP